eukprot:15462903-Alexandrium_andersonii.AAC.1
MTSRSTNRNRRTLRTAGPQRTAESDHNNVSGERRPIADPNRVITTNRCESRTAAPEPQTERNPIAGVCGRGS